MGGSAIKDSKRMDLIDYNLLKITIESSFNKFKNESNIDFNYHIVKAYKSKNDFGDMDIVVSSSDPSFKDKLHAWMQEQFYNHEPFEFVVNGPVISYGLSKRQVDIIFQCPEDYQFACNYFNYNDVSNLIGRITSKMGFKFGHNGLWFKYLDGDRLIKNICVTKDFKKALEAFGFSYEKFQDGFEDLNDIFKYISKNKYFNPEIYLLENRNHTARIRDKKRKTYMAFLEYCSNNTFNNIYEFNQDIHFYIDMIFLKFPMFLTEYVLCTYDTELARVSKEKLTTEIIRHHTGLDGIDLGNYIKATKLKFNSINDWHHVVIALPVSDILFIMDSNYKEYNQNVL